MRPKKITLLFLLVTTFILTYFPVWKGLIQTWRTSEEYSHGFMIFPISCYIIWRKRKSLAAIPVKPSNWGLSITLFSLSLYVFAHYAEIATLRSLSLIPLLVGITIYLYGFAMLKECRFALAFLLLMIPVPGQIYSQLTIPLQLFVSKASTFFSLLFSIPLFREGNIIHLPDRTLQVVHACSGLRSLISLLTICAVFGYLTLKSNILRTVLFFVGIPTAIFVNIVRVFLMILGFYYFGFDLTAPSIHKAFGVFIFLLGLFIIACVRGILSTWDKSPRQEA